jgi:5-methylcytosine-specific restriction endonuclease McrA
MFKFLVRRNVVLTDGNLWYLRNRIARFAGKEESVQDVLDALSKTNWSEFFPRHIECVGCREQVLFADTVPYPNYYIPGINEYINTSRGDDTFGYRLCFQCVNEVCCLCKTSKKQRQDKGYYRIICSGCLNKWNIDKKWMYREYQKVTMNESRTRESLRGDLPMKRWLETLVHFKFKCAYCLDRPYSHIEHFIPVRLGGNTDIKNCVPACRICNRRKWDHHPNDVTAIPQDALNRVSTYLQQL